jgi:RND family efflux transporter MFP subunit
MNHPTSPSARPPGRLRRLAPLALLLLAGAAMAGWVFSARSPDKAQADGKGLARPVQVARVHYAPLNPPRVLVGTVRARVESDIGFRVAGKIGLRKVQAGDRVKAGAVLAALDDTDLRLARESAEAELAAARSSAKQAELERDRIADLRRKGWSTEQAAERQNAVYDEASGRVSRAQRQVEISTNAQSYAELRAEADGVVIGVFAEAGQVVAAGQTVLRLARDGDREAQVAVPEQDLDFARRAGATAALWSDATVLFPAALRELSPNADAATRTFQARYTITGLAPDAPLGMTATLTLTAGGGKKGARLPLAAILNEGGGAEVYVVETSSGQLQRRPVTVLTYDARHAVVGEGLAEGDLVVTLGVHTLRAGLKVRPLPEAKIG